MFVIFHFITHFVQVVIAVLKVHEICLDIHYEQFHLFPVFLFSTTIITYCPYSFLNILFSFSWLPFFQMASNVFSSSHSINNSSTLMLSCLRNHRRKIPTWDLGWFYIVKTQVTEMWKQDLIVNLVKSASSKTSKNPISSLAQQLLCAGSFCL